jgi:hypothetical protein
MGRRALDAGALQARVSDHDRRRVVGAGLRIGSLDFFGGEHLGPAKLAHYL